jgi:hypothetical protein
LVLLPLKLQLQNGPFDLSWTPPPKVAVEKPLLQQVFSGTGPERSPFGNGRR